MAIEKAFGRIQHFFMIKVLERLGMQGTYVNVIKAVYRKLVTKVKLNGKKLKAISIKSGTGKFIHFLHIYSI